MRKNEQRLWDTMRRNAPGGFWLQRVENIVGEGMPDVYVVSPNGMCTWVELKAPVAPVRSTTRLMGVQGMRAAQINWHLKAASMGAGAIVLIRDSQSNLYAVSGAWAEHMNEWTTEQIFDHAFAHSWPAFWEAIT